MILKVATFCTLLIPLKADHTGKQLMAYDHQLTQLKMADTEILVSSRQKQWQERMRASSRCTQCGSPAAQGHTRCSPCLFKVKIYNSTKRK